MHCEYCIFASFCIILSNSGISLQPSDISVKRYEYYDWNVSSGECATSQPTAQQIANNVASYCIRRQNADSPMMVLIHDSGSRHVGAKALPVILDSLIKKGFIFISISPLVKSVNLVKK